ncbi:MAG: LytTR family DNA-binding domain-containing protein [Marinilabiliaceae bacterium]|jgi:DNA-binding LytR/AlgR family response regulator|nr:LytTR family DNA-binding domain-containing protein [Marinilabiliaceae bacterium]
MIRAIAVDDEPRALEVIEILSLKVPGVSLLDTFTDPGEALEYLKTVYIDLIFLDINMPDISGIQFIQKLTYKPHIILTTAYSEYALESYEYQVTDYLLKPIELDRFRKAISRVEDSLRLQNGNSDSEELSLFVKDGYRHKKIALDKLEYIKGEGNYLQFVCKESKAMSRMTFSDIIERLPGKKFLRIHNSYIVNMDKVDAIADNHVQIGSARIPIGSKYLHILRKRIDN